MGTAMVIWGIRVRNQSWTPVRSTRHQCPESSYQNGNRAWSTGRGVECKRSRSTSTYWWPRRSGLEPEKKTAIGTYEKVNVLTTSS